MIDFKQLFKDFENCSCGIKHECAIKDIRIESGLTARVGTILMENNFPKKLLLVADRNTLAASEGIREALAGFSVTEHIYDDLRVASMEVTHEIEQRLINGCEAILAVGSGSIHDPCRLAAARHSVPLCLFATAPSMDGFASYSSPIVENHFKKTHPAKCPEVILADTKILASAPAALKSAGFGDIIGKYIALLDWKSPFVIHEHSDDPYCEKVAGLTRMAADRCLKNASRVTLCDEEAAAELFETLLLSGIAMSFMKNSRPASGTEHMMAHFVECKELLEDQVPSYHGADVGLATLTIAKLYHHVAKIPSVVGRKEENNWDEIEAAYGPLADGMKKMNLPTTITHGIERDRVEKYWDDIRALIAELPPYEELKTAMEAAGCQTSWAEAGKSEELIRQSFLYHPYMRHRLTVRRILNMTNLADELETFPL